MFINLILSLFFHFLIVNAKLHHSEVSAKRWFFLKGVNPSDVVTHPSSNAIPHDRLTNDSPTLNQTAQAGNGSSPPPTPPASQTTTPDNLSSNLISGQYPEPQANDTSACTSSSGKAVTFVDRQCWFAAKLMADNGTGTSQCGNCVLGLFDADKKQPFKPAGPLNASFIEEQAMKLLANCKTNAPQKVSKRDSPPANPASEGTNVQLLVGYKAQAKPCPGL